VKERRPGSQDGGRPKAAASRPASRPSSALAASSTSGAPLPRHGRRPPASTGRPRAAYGPGGRAGDARRVPADRPAPSRGSGISSTGPEAQPHPVCSRAPPSQGYVMVVMVYVTYRQTDPIALAVQHKGAVTSRCIPIVANSLSLAGAAAGLRGGWLPRPLPSHDGSLQGPVEARGARFCPRRRPLLMRTIIASGGLDRGRGPAMHRRDPAGPDPRRHPPRYSPGLRPYCATGSAAGRICARPSCRGESGLRHGRTGLCRPSLIARCPSMQRRDRPGHWAPLPGRHAGYTLSGGVSWPRSLLTCPAASARRECCLRRPEGSGDHNPAAMAGKCAL
jgi:hypothetical protein